MSNSMPRTTPARTSNLGQLQRVQGRAGHVDQGPVGRDAQPGTPLVLDAGEPVPAGGRGARIAPLLQPVLGRGEPGRAAAGHERREVLPDAHDLRGHRHVAAPGPDIHGSVRVDHQGGRPGPQRVDHPAFGVVAAARGVHLEPAVERGHERPGLGERHGRGVPVGSASGGAERAGVQPGGQQAQCPSTRSRPAACRPAGRAWSRRRSARRRPRRPAGRHAPCPADAGCPNGISATGLGSGAPGTGWPLTGGTVCRAAAVCRGVGVVFAVAEPLAWAAVGAAGEPALHDASVRPTMTTSARRAGRILIRPACCATMTGS